MIESSYKEVSKVNSYKKDSHFYQGVNVVEKYYGEIKSEYQKESEENNTLLYSHRQYSQVQFEHTILYKDSKNVEHESNPNTESNFKNENKNK